MMVSNVRITECYSHYSNIFYKVNAVSEAVLRILLPYINDIKEDLSCVKNDLAHLKNNLSGAVSDLSGDLEKYKQLTESELVGLDNKLMNLDQTWNKISHYNWRIL